MFNSIKYFIITFFAFIFGYLIISFGLLLFPKSVENPLVQPKEVYVLYSPMHTDILFKVEDFNSSFLKEFQNKKRGYLSFGWGDKETYLNTPTWDDLSLLTASKALFINTPSAMHVSYLKEIDYYKELKTIPLSQQQLKALSNSIQKSFQDEKIALEGYGKIALEGYGKNDFFYLAKGSYNIFKTCNSWTGKQLRDVNVSMSYWTPLSQQVTTSLP